MKSTQEKWVIDRLMENGRVSRNDALKHFITRLGAIVCNLNNSGWEITGRFERTHGGYGRSKDYVYRLVSSPLKNS